MIFYEKFVLVNAIRTQLTKKSSILAKINVFHWF